MKLKLITAILTLGFFAYNESTPKKTADNEPFNKSILTQRIVNNLIIEDGQVLNIPPRLYNYDTIYVKANGTLKINDNSSRWVVFNVKTLICEGTIEYTNFKRGVGTVSFTFENGEIIEHTYIEGIGGSGGNGSGNGRKQGGLGYIPNSYEGGGGGSGAYYTGHPIVNLPGISATNFRGAPSPSSNSYTYGGNGARQAFGHGGLIYIIAEKIVFGTSAKFNLKGNDGINGSNGGYGACYGGGQVYYFAGGGGGGGTSGGNGGVLKVKCPNVTNSPDVNVNPGKGGNGGKGGKGGNCSYNGQDGLPGDNGEQGYVDWY